MLLCRRFVGRLQEGGCCQSIRSSVRVASAVRQSRPTCGGCGGAAGCQERWDLKLTLADWPFLAAGRKQFCSAVQDRGQSQIRGGSESQLEMENGLVAEVVKEPQVAESEVAEVVKEAQVVAEREVAEKAGSVAEDVPDKSVNDGLEEEDDYVLVSRKENEEQAGGAPEKVGEEAACEAANGAEEPPNAEVSRRSTFPDAEYFELTESCKLVLQSGDITEWYINGKTDGIVNAANERMLGGGGVDGAIHAAAGSGLYRACRAVPQVQPGVRCPTGQAVVTDAFDLPVAKVIHTVGPVYQGRDSETPLRSAYKNSVDRALEAGLEYVCFPAISCGIYSYPHGKAAEVALETLRENAGGLREVHFVLFDFKSQKAWFREARANFKSLNN